MEKQTKSPWIQTYNLVLFQTYCHGTEECRHW